MFQLSAQLSEVTGVMNPTEDGFSWALQRIQKEESGSSQGMQRETCGSVRRPQRVFQCGERSSDQD